MRLSILFCAGLRTALATDLQQCTDCINTWGPYYGYQACMDSTYTHFYCCSPEKEEVCQREFHFCQGPLETSQITCPSSNRCPDPVVLELSKFNEPATYLLPSRGGSNCVTRVRAAQGVVGKAKVELIKDIELSTFLQPFDLLGAVAPLVDYPLHTFPVPEWELILKWSEADLSIKVTLLPPDAPDLAEEASLAQEPLPFVHRMNFGLGEEFQEEEKLGHFGFAEQRPVGQGARFKLGSRSFVGWVAILSFGIIYVLAMAQKCLGSHQKTDEISPFPVVRHEQKQEEEAVDLLELPELPDLSVLEEESGEEEAEEEVEVPLNQSSSQDADPPREAFNLEADLELSSKVGEVAQVKSEPPPNLLEKVSDKIAPLPLHQVNELVPKPGHEAGPGDLSSDSESQMQSSQGVPQVRQKQPQSFVDGSPIAGDPALFSLDSESQN